MLGKTRHVFGRGTTIVLVALLAVTLSLQSAQAAGLLIADGGLGGVLAIEEHTVRVTVNGGIAVTEVTQVFRNTENRQVEALYSFPVPRGATVADFSMWINDKEMVGEVVEKHTKNYAQASLEASGGDLGRDVVLTYRVDRPRTGIDTIASKVAGEDGYFYLTLTAGDELVPHNTGMDYVFVLDISGSMADDGKLRTSRQSLEAFIKGLEKDDRFEIVTFNVAANPLFRQLRPASEDNRRQGVAFLESQQARGGTVLGPAITTSYRYRDPDRPLNVVILSDGLTEQRDRAELLALMRQRPSNARVFCIGVGNDVDRPLLEQLADDAGGLSAFISRDDDFARTAQAFRRKLSRPAATNVELKFDGVEVYDLEPKTLSNLYHGMPVRLYGRYRKGGAAKVSLRAHLGGSELRQSATINFPTDATEIPEIERMWAFHKMQRLLKDADRSGSRDAVIDEVVRLGEAYSIVSEYTSFLVLENDT